MKISARSSGGFAGLSEQYDIDTQAHPAGPGLEAALASSGFFTHPQATSTQVGADIPQWQITVNAPTARRTITFAEDGSAENAHWQQLLRQIRASA
ncbi:protealysin inhibitor emfourin [Janthinobacterium sp. P210006]|uniref:protealysin inhibitor emfourin n=1 Tax=Janthinobacterium sp. P210006 TaxID=3112939 RepID=UPI002E256964|nr:protealysin inhibitor emfourin [Janthinobacterium sp. P210006]